MKHIDAINSALKEGYITHNECKQFLDLARIEFKTREFVKTYEKVWGKNGVKDIDKMTTDELIEHAHILMKSLKDGEKNE